MQSPKIELLLKYNNLIDSAFKASGDFPEKLCEMLVSEHEAEAAVMFKVMEDKSLNVIGKSIQAKQIYLKNSKHQCAVCQAFSENPDPVSFDTHQECLLQTSDFMMSEGCLSLKAGSEKLLIKIAKKTPFSQTDKDNFVLAGNAIRNIIDFWLGNKGNSENALSEIIAEIGHELRTPTNSIMGFASLLNEENLTSSQSEYVATLKESAFNLLSLLNDLIDLAKLERGKTKDSVTNVNIKNFIDDIVNLFTGKVNKNNIEFLVNINAEVPDTVKLDSLRLRYILINIITFSMRLTERGKITISVSKGNSNNLSFRISDTSSGLTSNKIKDIFRPFIISELSSSKIGSTTGLSLILAKKYIESLHGNIDVSSMVGKGITYNFTIGMETLPVMSALETQISSLPKGGKKNRVLVVEDDYATSKLLSNYLNKWGYEPVIVNAGEQALKAIENEVFLAILMDIVLPDMNGFELLKTLRENKNTKHTPVIVCSIEAEQQKAFLMGAVEYFVKPINYNFLVEVLTSYKLKKDSNILIVDDDVPTLNLMKETVVKSGFNAVAESHSLKVSDMIDNMSLDLAIVDLDMPGLNGYDLIKQIKSKPKFSKLPIIIYTGKENYQEDLKKIDGMFEELLEKSSTNIEDLAETINAMINKYDEPASPTELITKTDVIKILLVEDYKHSQIIVTRLLKKNNFDSIVVVENGLEAFEEVKKQKYDLILMDMQMPVMNGFEATEKIRALPDYKETPIIALTAFAMKGDREKCLEAGATDYIPKPIDSQEFIEKVKYYTEQKLKLAQT
jgi:CheY-like chemotaxis protein